MKLGRNMLVLLLACAISASLVVGAQGKITLTVWSQLDDPKQMAVIEEIIRKLEQMRPNVKVEHTPLAREDMDKVLPVSLGAGIGPDIADYDTGDAFLGSIVRAELVYDMTKVYEERGWTEKIRKAVQEAVTYGGRIWAVPYGLEVQGLWYNQVVFRKLGLGPPTTFKKFLAAAEAAKTAGYTPIAFGSQTICICPQLLANIVYGLIPKDIVYDASTLKGQKTWKDDPRFLEATQIHQDWAKKKYLSPNPNAISFGETQLEFFSGKAAMSIIGPWSAGSCKDRLRPGVFEPLFLPFPPIDTSLPLANHGATASAFFVNRKSEDLYETATDFIELGFVRDEGTLLWLRKLSILPVTKLDVDIDEVIEDPILASVAKSTDEVMADGGCGGIWLDQFVSPEASEVFNYGIQSMLDFSKTPEKFIDEISKATIEARKKAGLR